MKQLSKLASLIQVVVIVLRFTLNCKNIEMTYSCK